MALRGAARPGRWSLEETYICKSRIPNQHNKESLIRAKKDREQRAERSFQKFSGLLDRCNMKYHKKRDTDRGLTQLGRNRGKMVIY
jgi:hypothetical protein